MTTENRTWMTPSNAELPPAELPRADTTSLVEPNQPAGHTANQSTSLWAYPATYFLVAINVIVFAVMLRYSPAVQLMRQHAGWRVLTAQFDAGTLLRFGASDSNAVLDGQWWRLLTSTFVHVTILHLALNMWCLWNLGLFGEPLLGKPGLIAVYLLTGTAGMMMSLAWSILIRQDTLVAGASGAVFGLAGILIVLLSNRKLAVPWKELRALRRSVIWFAALNLALGILPRLVPVFLPSQLGRMHLSPDSLPRIDNTAHLGGFLTGLALGLPLFPRMASGKSSYRSRQMMVFAAAALLICLLGYSLSKLA